MRRDSVAGSGREAENKGRPGLDRLSRLYGIQTVYTDVSGKRRHASQEALFAVLRAMGAPVENMRDIPGGIHDRRLQIWKRRLEPVTPVWEGKPAGVELRVRDGHQGTMTARIEPEEGEAVIWSFDPASLPTLETADLDGGRYLLKSVPIPHPLPRGYHRLIVEATDGSNSSTIIAAPVRAFSGESKERIWGVFLPLYALHTKGSWGAGDFSDLEALQGWVSRLGGSMAATLPFLASYLDDPFEPSPYSPASRLFWNEFYLDLKRIPELRDCPSAREALHAVESGEVSGLRSQTLVDYRRQMSLKRKVLQELSLHFFHVEPGNRHVSFREYLSDHPDVEDYARFRAVTERRAEPWPKWPVPLRDGTVRPGDYDRDRMNYHLYAQWLAHDQIEQLAERSSLYLDLPLGIHPAAYDPWRERGLFPEDVSGGAPPDIVFSRGQDWGFPPLHPERIRLEGYRYVRRYLAHIMKQAGLMRIDHAPWMHRIYWIPGSLDASRGVYVRYRSEEIYAILSLESHRNRCRLIGENLGTVPGYVNEALSRHNVQKMYVVQYELEAHDPEVLPRVPVNVTASLNTHDMAPFGGFLEGTDIQDRRDIGLLSARDFDRERKAREKTRKDLEGFLRRSGRLEKDGSKKALLEACLAYLSASSARIVLVNMEDLWLELSSQNLPGTSTERPNWRRKARYGLEEILAMPEIAGLLRMVNDLRKARAESARKEKAR